MASGKEFVIKVQPKVSGSSQSGRSSSSGSKPRQPPVLSVLFRPADSEQLGAAGMQHVSIPAWGAGFGDSPASPGGSCALAEPGATAAGFAGCKQPAYYFGILQQKQPAALSWNGMLSSPNGLGQSSLLMSAGDSQVRWLPPLARGTAALGGGVVWTRRLPFTLAPTPCLQYIALASPP